MSDEVRELAERLRNATTTGAALASVVTLREAATALESLAAERDRLAEVVHSIRLATGPPEGCQCRGEFECLLHAILEGGIRLVGELVECPGCGKQHGDGSHYDSCACDHCKAYSEASRAALTPPDPEEPSDG